MGNLADAPHAATFRFSTHGTTAGFDAQVGASVNGASLRASATYTLKGTVVFAHGSSHSTVVGTLTFRTCPNP